MTNAARCQRGFSLLELLVACAIMAIALGMLYRATGGSARTVAEVDLRQRATVLAESLLALSDDVPPGGWQQQGRSGELVWSIRSAPYATGVDAGNAPLLHEVSIAISWADGGSQRQFELQTLRPERRALAGEANQ
ncbi:type II secretion system protein [Verminephrobacter eiseniae]|uniref:type II secretion system protein n=1 Tax=Verminephrobacter eiseniae TaxID=364317 RepID=UPI002238D513|nr:prepilin-type N-terminal cleavage/methylation domain-containing protein [Verminephrobacter eiseniae]MCW5235992.1 prepilin-type N-terminal cleavage/methylation domain-containing protein [Verminephrobacter eiseniae]